MPPSTYGGLTGAIIRRGDGQGPAEPLYIDVSSTLEIYAGFGFVERYRDEAWMILSRGMLTLEFFHHPELEPKASHFQCTVSVIRPRRTVGGGARGGVRISSQGQPRLHRPRIEESGLRIGYLVDPDGTQLTLIEEPGR